MGSMENTARDPAQILNEECMIHVLSFHDFGGAGTEETHQMMKVGKIYCELSSLSHTWKEVLDKCFARLVGPLALDATFLAMTSWPREAAAWAGHHQLKIKCVTNWRGRGRDLDEACELFLLRNLDTSQLEEAVVWVTDAMWLQGANGFWVRSYQDALADECPTLQVLDFSIVTDDWGCERQTYISDALFSHKSVHTLKLGLAAGPRHANSIFLRIKNLPCLQKLCLKHIFFSFFFVHPALWHRSHSLS